MPDLGDVVPLSITVRDADGNLADAGSVTLTITLPDGTATAVGPVASTSTGVYDHDFATTQPGRHGVRWVATGANASAFTDAFTVEPADPGPWVSLAEVKAHMDKTGTGDDAELAGHIHAACQMIVDRIGPVTPVAAVDVPRVGWGQDTIVLDKSPVISVTSVTVPGGVTIPQGDLDNGVAGWELDAAAGVLTHTACWPRGRIRITYRAGRSPVGGNITLAAKELAAHLWRSSQLNSGGGRPPIADNEPPMMPGSTWALPIRVRELLGLGRNPTSDILVG